MLTLSKRKNLDLSTTVINTGSHVLIDKSTKAGVYVSHRTALGLLEESDHILAHWCLKVLDGEWFSVNAWVTGRRPIKKRGKRWVRIRLQFIGLSNEPLQELGALLELVEPG